MISNVCIVDNLPSTDHDAIHFMLNITVSLESPCKRVLYNYKRADMSVFLETLSHVPWHIIKSASDIEELWQLFKDLFFSVVDMTIPCVKWKKSTGSLKKLFIQFGGNAVCIYILNHYRIPHHLCCLSIVLFQIMFKEWLEGIQSCILIRFVKIVRTCGKG